MQRLDSTALWLATLSLLLIHFVFLLLYLHPYLCLYHIHFISISLTPLSITISTSIPFRLSHSSLSLSLSKFPLALLPFSPSLNSLSLPSYPLSSSLALNLYTLIHKQTHKNNTQTGQHAHKHTHENNNTQKKRQVNPASYSFVHNKRVCASLGRIGC